MIFKQLLRKSASFFALLCLAICIGCSQKNPSSSTIPFDEVSGIHPADAFDFFDARPKDIPNPSDTKVFSCVGFKLKTRYPAESVIAFYKEKLKAMGYVPYKDSKWTGGKYKWVNFIGGSKGQNTCVYQYMMDWVNKDQTRIANLGIYYYSPVSKTTSMCGEKPETDLTQAFIMSEPFEWRIK